jgi:hypothetical protein
MVIKTDAVKPLAALGKLGLFGFNEIRIINGKQNPRIFTGDITIIGPRLMGVRASSV